MDLARAAADTGLIYDDHRVVWDGYKTNREVGRSSLGKHYGEWLASARRFGLLPTEFLVPRVIVPFSDALPASMQAVAGKTAAEAGAFLDTASDDWGYYFSLGGGLSTLGPEARLNAAGQVSRYRSLHRLRIIGTATAGLFGDRLAQMSVTDLACNWGAFSLEMAARGAGAVTGVDLRAENIEKARSLAEYTGIATPRFEIANVYELGRAHRADIVLNLGLLYHVTKQYELVKATYELCNVAAIIETITHKEPFAGFILGTGGNIPAEHAAGEIRTELHPTYRALIDMMLMVGFEQVLEFDGDPDPGWTGYPADVFGTKLRRILVGIKRG